jgi:hypothetical protein
MAERMHDGAPAHFSRAVRDVVDPLARPPPSPDLNPLDFYLLRHPKAVVYASFVDNEEADYHCTVDTCQTIRSYYSIFVRMHLSMMRRVKKCAESSHVGHFEPLLQWYSFSYNSQVKCFRAHVDKDFFCMMGVTRSQNLFAPFSYTL